MKKTKAQRRVAIARDVIRQLETRKTKAQAGTYCFFEREMSTDEAISEGLFQKFAVKSVCEACAIGALFVAKVRREDSFAPAYMDNYIRESSLRDELKELFTGEQLRLIENSFEGWTDNAIADILNDRSRMIAIMKNIIKNKGTFVVPKEKIKA